MSTWSWHKIDTEGWLKGSIRVDMTTSQRGVFADLIALASSTRLRDGTLRFAYDKPMGREYIANTLNITLEELNSCIEVCMKDKNQCNDKHRIEIWEDGTIELVNYRDKQKVDPEWQNKQDFKDKMKAHKKAQKEETNSKQDEALSQSKEANERSKSIEDKVDKLIGRGGNNE